jgi:putative oxidoreductase
MIVPLARFTDLAYAAFRIVFGLLFACHGAQKVFGAFGGQVQPLASLAGLGGLIELGCGLLILIGLLTGLAAFIASGEMAVAYFMVHAPRAFWPILNEGEPAVLYCFAFLYMAARGGGKYSVDAGMKTGRRL